MACMRDGFEQGRPLDNGRFVTVSPLNHGSFGMVLAARDTTTGNDVAIKCITKPAAASTCPAAVATDERSEELAIHSKLPDHPHIVNMITSFQTENHQYMVLELCSNGDLYEAIRLGKGPLETGHVRDFMLQLVSAVEHLHANGVYHRDIKPENIFLTSDANMKLGDFGLATTETWSTEFAVGSDRYMAPEQYDAGVYGYGYSPAAADIWAIGIVLLNVIFQRNPFAVPTPKDPLFNDFARDRQSMFDVFPNMSQDTYNILQHSLALDPANRSLSAVREALENVVSFTTDDEVMDDDFCTNETELVPVATAAREPLRTPSLTSPNLSSGDSFPWATALLKTPQKQSRQLSTIRDEDFDLFPESANNSEWQYVDADEASLSSNLDSGLGMSYKSTKSTKSTQSMQSMESAKRKSGFVGSLPISFSRPSTKSSPYGANGFSKSWSDLWDEEEEEMQIEEQPLEDAAMDVCMDFERVTTAKPCTPQLPTVTEDGRGSVTPRQAFATIDANVGAATPLRESVNSSEVKAGEKPVLAKTKSSSILDKWAALGSFRRAKQQESAPVATAAATPPKTKYSEAFASFTPFSSSKKAKPTPKTQPKQRERAPSWRQGSPQRLRSSSFNSSKVWQDDNNWREHKHQPHMNTTTLPMSMPMAMPTPMHRIIGPKKRSPERSFLDDVLDDDIKDEDLEWSGWRMDDLHL